VLARQTNAKKGRMHHDANHAEGGDVIDEQDGAFGWTTSGSAVVISVLVIGCSSREVFL
jgi:hypothetical protein